MASAHTEGPYFQELAADQRGWLKQFDRRYGSAWERLLNNNPEAAYTEVVVRKFLEANTVRVEPNEDLNGEGEAGAEQRPDFRCSRDGYRFYVEVTCLGVDKVSEMSHLQHDEFGDNGYYSPITPATFSACVKKAKQCSGTDAPTLLAIGTFHSHVQSLFAEPFVEMTRTGKTSISWMVDTATGSGVGEVFETTEFLSASFMAPNGEQGFNFKRCSISGLLFVRGAYVPTVELGVLHPDPERPFDPQVLPTVRFGEVVIVREHGQLCVQWPAEATSVA